MSWREGRRKRRRFPKSAKADDSLERAVPLCRRAPQRLGTIRDKMSQRVSDRRVGLRIRENMDAKKSATQGDRQPEHLHLRSRNFGNHQFWRSSPTANCSLGRESIEVTERTRENGARADETRFPHRLKPPVPILNPAEARYSLLVQPRCRPRPVKASSPSLPALMIQ